MPSKRVNTATLIRGAILSFRIPMHLQKKPEDKEPIRFKAKEPQVISDPKILSHLEDMIEEVPDGEGELYEKPVFHVERGVAEPGDSKGNSRKRLSSSRTVKKRRIKRT